MGSSSQVVPPPPPGFAIEDAVPPPPAGFSLEAQAPEKQQTSPVQMQLPGVALPADLPGIAKPPVPAGLQTQQFAGEQPHRAVFHGEPIEEPPAFKPGEFEKAMGAGGSYGATIPKLDPDAPFTQKATNAVQRTLADVLSPAEMAKMLPWMIAGEAIPIAANLKPVAEKLKDFPKVLKAIDAFSQAAVPAAATITQGKGLYDKGLPHDTEDAIETGIRALLMGATAYGAINAAKGSFDTYPTEEATGGSGRPNQPEYKAGVPKPPSPSQRADATVMAENLEAQGRNLAAQPWKDIAHYGQQKPFSVTLNNGQGQAVQAQVEPMVNPKGLPGYRVVDPDGVVLASGRAPVVQAFLDRQSWQKPSGEAGGAAEVGGGVTEPAELPQKTMLGPEAAPAQIQPAAEIAPAIPEPPEGFTIEEPVASQFKAGDEFHSPVGGKIKVISSDGQTVTFEQELPGGVKKAPTVPIGLFTHLVGGQLSSTGQAPVPPREEAIQKPAEAPTESAGAPQEVKANEEPSAPSPAGVEGRAPEVPALPQDMGGGVPSGVEQPGVSALPAGNGNKAPEAPEEKEVEAPKEHDYSSTQFNLPETLASKVREVGKTIPDSELVEDGREENPHITGLYGTETNDAADIAKIMEGQGPITAKIKTMSIFPGKDGKPDVVKLDIDSPDLHKVNAKLKALPNHNDHPVYTPHITIGYVRNGEGKKYAGRAIPGLSGQTITFDAATFSPKSGEKTQIPLKAKETSAKDAFKMKGPELKALADKGDAGAKTEIERRLAKNGKAPEVKVPQVEEIAGKESPSGPIPNGSWMNQWEIQEAADRYKKHPVLGKATKFLQDYQEDVNSNSDGWPYWKQPAQAATQLMGLIQNPEYATEENLNRALGPIRSFYTRRGNAAGMKFPEIDLQAPKKAKPSAQEGEKKPVTPQIIPADKGEGYVLPTFATAGAAKAKESGSPVSSTGQTPEKETTPERTPAQKEVLSILGRRAMDSMGLPDYFGTRENFTYEEMNQALISLIRAGDVERVEMPDGGRGFKRVIKRAAPQEKAPEEEAKAPPAKNEPTIEPAGEPPHANAPAGEDQEALAGVPTEDVSATPEERETPGGDQKRGPINGGRIRAGGGAGVSARPSEGVDEGDVGVSPSGERTTPPRREPTKQQRIRAGSDYHITDADHLGEGGVKQKAADNIEAIRTLKRIEVENRPATPDEQRVLAKYVGWGGMPQIFQQSWQIPREWTGLRADLEGLLDEKEFESARASTPNAHYTSATVINGMWDAVKRLGLMPEGGLITTLEPAVGSGNFYGLMPEGTKAQRVGVELDSVTGRIAKLLYPQADIHVAGFEAVRLPNDYFDLAISNVPFGNYPVHDPTYKKTPAVTRSIHDYFFAKALDKVRPGGVVAFITSSYTMDKQDPYIRKYLADRADLIGSIRLPNTAFKGNAGTEVTTDIIFLQKRAEGQKPAGEAWTTLKPVQGSRKRPDGSMGSVEIPVNEYYANHPEMMLGKMALTGTMYASDTPTLEGELTKDNLAAAVDKLPKDIVKPWEAPTQAFESVSSIPGAGEVKDGAYTVKDGQLLVRKGDQLRPVEVGVEQAKRIRGQISIRNAMHEVFRTQRDESSEPEITAAMKKLGATYDAFTKANGPLHKRENAKAFADDPDAAPLLALENWDKETGKATKSDIFTKRVIDKTKPAERADNAKDALGLVLNEKGRIDWSRMQELTGNTPEEMQEELGPLVFQNPAGKAWEPSDEYLSGNVRKKLADAEAAAKMDKKFEKNVEALKAVQPKDLVPGEIKARLGAPWIPTEDVRQFISEILDMPLRTVAVAHNGALATWAVNVGRKETVANQTTYGTARYYGHELLEDAMNLRSPTVYDTVGSGADAKKVINDKETLAARETQKVIKDKFAEWVWEHPERAERLSQTYNIEQNSDRLWQPDGSHLTFPGMALGLKLRPHQKNGVWRIIRGDGNVLLAHTVGSGKTLEIVTAAMELRRLGRSRKPMVVVPKNRVEGTAEEWMRAYPAANILTVGGDDFDPSKRHETMARIATGNWDGVIVAYEPFGKLPVSDETFNEFLQTQIDNLENYIRDARGDKADARIVKDLEKSKKRLEAKIRNTAKREEKDKGVNFEDLGVDSLFVDEADSFKNLQFPTKMTRISGIPNTESQRAFDMFIKSQYIARRNGGRGLIFATGTPVANSMAEVWTMQRYLQPKYLMDHGLEHFDAWAQTFGEVNPALEITPDGSGVRVTNKFNKFVNAPELIMGFRKMADVQTARMLKLPVPKLKGNKPTIVSAKASEAQLEYLKKLAERAKKVKGKKPMKGADNILVVQTDGQKAAIDMRLVDPFQPDNPDSKVNMAVQRIYKIWKDTAKDKSTQLVFLDLSTPKKKGDKRFSVYEDMRDKLIAHGIPANEIAFMQNFKSDDDKEGLFASVNKGRVRILFGSTGAMGVGVNVQKKLIAMHQLDAPYRPRDVEQREGRMIRQGNENPEVEIFRYVTEPSFDARKWDILQGKASYINPFMEGDISVREIEDVSDAELSYGEIAAIASGNPAIREKVMVDTEIRKLDAMRSRFEQQRYTIGRELHNLPMFIKKDREDMAKADADIATRDANEPVFTIGKKEFTGKDARKEAAAALGAMLDKRQSAKATTFGPDTFQIGKYRGFNLVGADWSSTDGVRKPADIIIQGELHYKSTNNYEDQSAEDMGSSLVQSIEAKTRAIESVRDAKQRDIDSNEKKLADTKAISGKKFEQDDKLKALLARQSELEKILQTNAPDASTIGSADDEVDEGPGDEEGDLSSTGQPKNEGERGSAPALVDLIQGIQTAIQGGNYSPAGAVESSLIRGLGQTKRASQPVHEAMLRAASPEARSAAIIRASIPLIRKALADSGVPVEQLFQYYVDSRLQALRQFWQDLSSQANELTNEEMAKDFKGGDEDGSMSQDFVDTLDNLEGKKGIPENPTQIAAALIEAKDWDGLRDYLANVFETASDGVAPAMEPALFDYMNDLVKSDARVKEADRLYGEHIEKPIAENHALNEGIFSDRLGPAGRYFPLIPGGEGKPSFFERLGFKKPKNSRNVMATGLSREGYTVNTEKFRQSIQKDLAQGGRAAVIEAAYSAGLMRKVPRKASVDTDVFTWRGKEYPAKTVMVSPSRMVIQNGKSFHTKSVQAYMPQWFYDEIKDVLDKQGRGDPGIIRKVLEAINTFALQGPADLTFHSANLVGALIANTPFLSPSLGGIAASSNILSKKIQALTLLATVDPTEEEAVKAFHEMAEAGALPTRYASVTYSKDLAALTGAELVRWTLAPMLYGPKGIDARARYIMWKVAKAINPDAKGAELNEFINQLGNYTPALWSDLEKRVKSFPLSPFFTAGSTMIRNGVNAFFSSGPMISKGEGGTPWVPRNPMQARLMHSLMVGFFGTIGLWFLLSKAATGKYPWQDKRSKFLSIPVGGGSGPIDKYRHSKLGNTLWGKGPEVGYVNIYTFNPLFRRGAMAMGIPGAYETKMLGGTFGQASESAEKDSINTLLHPFAGPEPRAAFAGATGKQLYVTSLRDQSGRTGVNFMSAIPDKTKPGWPTIGRKTLAAAMELNAFAQSMAEIAGVNSDDKRETGSAALHNVIDMSVIGTGLVGSATNPFKRAEAVRKQKLATK